MVMLYQIEVSRLRPTLCSLVTVTLAVISEDIVPGGTSIGTDFFGASVPVKTTSSIATNDVYRVISLKFRPTSAISSCFLLRRLVFNTLQFFTHEIVDTTPAPERSQYVVIGFRLGKLDGYVAYKILARKFSVSSECFL